MKTEKIILSGLIILILSAFAIEASAFRGGAAGADSESETVRVGPEASDILK